MAVSIMDLTRGKLGDLDTPYRYSDRQVGYGIYAAAGKLIGRFKWGYTVTLDADYLPIVSPDMTPDDMDWMAELARIEVTKAKLGTIILKDETNYVDATSLTRELEALYEALAGYIPAYVMDDGSATSDDSGYVTVVTLTSREDQMLGLTILPIDNSSQG